MKDLETNRLILRKLRLEDLEDFYSYAKKTTIGPMAGWSPHLSLAESEYILRDMMIKDEVNAIVYKDNNKMIGTLGIHPFADEEFGRELGFVIDDVYWGRGLMVELCQEVIKTLFVDGDAKTIYCGHFAHNFRSRRVIEKLNFQLYKVTADERFETYTDKVYLYKLRKENYLGEGDNERF